MKNRRVFRSRISERQFRHIARLFSLDLNAVQIAALTGLSRVSINRHLRALRQRMAEYCEAAGPMSGEIEVDESYFGARRVRGKRAWGEAHINGIECFWEFAKSRLAKPRGMLARTVLKNANSGSNHRREKVCEILLKSR